MDRRTCFELSKKDWYKMYIFFFILNYKSVCYLSGSSACKKKSDCIYETQANKISYFFHKKRLLYHIHIDAFINVNASFTVHAVVDQLKHLITPDMTESACTTVCESVISGIGLFVCPSACNM